MRIRLWTVPLALAVTLGACNDQLTEVPKAFLTTDTFYRTQADLQSGVIAIYSQLRTTFNFGTIAWYGMDNASDQANPDAGETTAAVIGLAQVAFNASTPQGTEAIWPAAYLLIYRANLVIERAPDIAMDATLKAQWVAEAKFLRAYAYLQLSKRFSAGGTDASPDVPLLLTTADHAKPDIARATTAQVHAQIVKDLTDAEAGLPTAQTGTSTGRATKAAAQMATADLYLWRSSFLKSAEWQKASDAAKKIIDVGTFGLNDNYFATFLPSNKGNREMIFRIVAASDARASTGVVSTYYPRILGFSPAGGGFGLGQPTTWMIGSYAAGDYRGNTGPQSDTVGYRTTGSTAAGVARTFSPHPWKFRASSLDNTLGDVDVPLYRYAETLLIYAEAQNELGNSAVALQALNQVRARARKGTGTQTRAQPADIAGASGPTLRNAIYAERNWEFAFEAKRWFDLVRRDALEPGYFKTQLESHDPAAILQGPVTDVKKRFPIPGTEVLLLPTLTQNPGY